MALTDFLIGRAPDYDRENDELAKPIMKEAEDLSIHVELCARRYGRIMQGQAQTAATLHDLKVLVVQVVFAAMLGLAAILKGPELIIAILKAL